MCLLKVNTLYATKVTQILKNSSSGSKIMQNQAYFLFRLGNKRQMPYFFSVFTRRKHTFSIQETYISPSRDIRFPAGKHKKCQEPFPSTPQRFLIHLSLFFLSASRQTTTHKLPEKAFEIQRIFPIFVHIIIHILTES